MRSIPLLLLLLSCPAPALAQGADLQAATGTLTVRGIGHYERNPDNARIQVSVSTRGRTRKDASDAHAERTNRALAILKSLDRAKTTITETSYELREERVQTSRSNAAPDHLDLPFEARTSVIFEISSLDRLNVVMSRLAEADLFEVRTITFGASADREALSQARRAAIADATEQAGDYADAANVRLVAVSSISDGNIRRENVHFYSNNPVPASLVLTPPDKLNFEASVVVSWHIAPR